jgi:flagellar basal body rod protein FlgG
MVYGLWQSAAGLQAQEYRQAIIANNLANAETPGFKADRIAFQERLNAASARGDLSAKHPALQSMTGGVFETPVYTDFSQGGIIPSNSAMDIAVDGSGFLTVQSRDGVRYTRDGRLMLDSAGRLVHAATGNAIIGADGQPIVLDPGSAEPIRIDETGQVRQGTQTAGRLAVVDFADHRQLQKTGGNLYAADASARPVEADGLIKQSGYEASGVEPITTLVQMIEATRAYEANARLISLQDESLGRAVSELGRVA